MFKLELSGQEVEAILNILAKEPYSTVFQLINKITADVNNQQAESNKEGK